MTVDGGAGGVERSSWGPRPLNPLLLLAGLVLVLLAAVDAFWTILWIDQHSGPVASRITTWLRRWMRRAFGRGEDRRLSLTGPLTVTAVAGTWILLTWAGWSLVFLSGEAAVVSTSTGVVAGVAERVYFAGYTIFTLGNGEFIPQGTGWRLATVAAAGNGIVLVTLGVTYLVTLLQAAVQQRAFAHLVLGLGRTPRDLTVVLWNGGDQRGMETLLVNLADHLRRVSVQHHAYPVLHTYHASAPDRAAPLAAAVVDEALTILLHGTPEASLRRSIAMRTARAAVGTYLSTLRTAGIDIADEPPPAPSLADVAAQGVPVVDEARFLEAVADESERRRLLLGVVKANGWTWRDVAGDA